MAGIVFILAAAFLATAAVIAIALRRVRRQPRKVAVGNGSIDGPQERSPEPLIAGHDLPAQVPTDQSRQVETDGSHITQSGDFTSIQTEAGASLATSAIATQKNAGPTPTASVAPQKESSPACVAAEPEEPSPPSAIVPANSKQDECGHAVTTQQPAQEPAPRAPEPEAAVTQTPEGLEAPTKPRKVLRIRPTGDNGPKPRAPKPPAATSSTRETRVRVYEPPDISEFASPAAYDSPTWVQYRKWNRALTSFFLLSPASSSTACLAVTPRILAAAWQKAEGITLQPDGALDTFAHAVGALYRDEVLSHSEGLRILRSTAPDSVPLCTAFLALAVLAAYTMRTEGGYTANAYYARLADLLVCQSDDRESLPFEPDEYYALWAYLKHWVHDRQGTALPLPARQEATRFYVDLALFHVPLRQVDLERLPRFFLHAKFSPAERLPSHVLDTALRHWCEGRRPFTQAGMDAVQDERRSAVLVQITHELEIWDGTGEDEEGRTNANVEILLEFFNRQPRLSYLARCPAGFPPRFEPETQRPPLQTATGCWYEPSLVPASDGARLASGFSWRLSSGGRSFALRRLPAKVIPLVSQENGSGLISRNTLLLGCKCAVMCLNELATATTQYLSEVCRRQCTPSTPEGFPDGWTLFVGVKALRCDIHPPQDLEPLAPDSSARISFIGGLRFDNAYLKDAPPTISITGLEASTNEIRIDQNRVALDDEGYVVDCAPLLTIGAHTITAGMRSRNLEIVDSDLAPILAVLHPALDGALPKTRLSTVVAVPKGDWHIFGPEIGDIGKPKFVLLQGTIMQCGFQPLWAVCCDNRKRPTVVYLSDQPQIPRRLSRRLIMTLKTERKVRLNASRWASCIRFANHPRAQIICADGRNVPESVREAWVSFQRTAHEIARQIRQR